jgi:diguanylate cyclase (GGDEF)-like protein
VPYGQARLTFGNFLDITNRKELEAQLQHQAFHDPLTGLPNRALLLERLTHALALQPAKVAVLYCDLDDFKKVNDGFGHHAGDALLETLGQRWRSRLRPGTTLARLGGDEFVIVLEGCEGAMAAGQVAGELLVALREPFIVTGHAVRVTQHRHRAGPAVVQRPGRPAPARGRCALPRQDGGQGALRAGLNRRRHHPRRGGVAHLLTRRPRYVNL